MSTYKNSDGRWMVDVQVQLPDRAKPIRKRKVSPVQTKRGAEHFERQIRSAILAGTLEAKPQAKTKTKTKTKTPSSRAPNLETWSRTFVAEYCEAGGLAPSTAREYRTAFQVHVLPILGTTVKIDAIRTQHFARLRTAIMAKGLAPKTTNNVLGALSRAVGYFYERQGLPVPHFDACRVKVPKSPPKFWEPEQYERLVDAAAERGPTQLAMVLLMGDCGLRTGEVIALESGHLRWRPEPQIVVQRSHWRGHFGPPKGGRPRTVPMTARVVAALRALPRSITHPWALVRDSKHGRGHETHCSLAYAMGHVERAAGLGKAKPRAKGRLHRLRHTFVTRLAAANVPPRAIMELAGHTRIETTMRYMHLIAGAGSRAIAALESFDQGEQSRGRIAAGSTAQIGDRAATTL